MGAWTRTPTLYQADFKAVNNAQAPQSPARRRLQPFQEPAHTPGEPFRTRPEDRRQVTPDKTSGDDISDAARDAWIPCPRTWVSPPVFLAPRTPLQPDAP